MSEQGLHFLPAHQQAALVRSGELSARELLDSHLRRIEQVNVEVNAIVTLVPELAQTWAKEADERQARGEPLGPLHGLPIAHKDLVCTEGIRTTFGSPIYENFIPQQDDLIIERLRSGGAITIGKTNTPEFGAGSQTFNRVFGATRNPYDYSRTCGGSSGGAAVALACGMIPIADGSDTGGSLRNPAAFCNVVGFRPSPGRVPAWPSELAWFPISVQGPMARTVQDVALLLTAIAGPDPRSPIAIGDPPEMFARPLERGFEGVRIAWSSDFGELPVAPEVSQVMAAQRVHFESLGCVVEDGQPDFRDADEIFKAWRAWAFEQKFAPHLEANRDQLKDTIIWNAEAGRSLTGPQLARLEQKRTHLYHRVREFMEDYEFLVFPVTQVPPFSVDEPYVDQINGVAMDTYIDWMKSCYYITVTGLPAISVPGGFTQNGLPIGLQIVGRHQDDFGVLQLAHAFEQVTGYWQRHPKSSE